MKQIILSEDKHFFTIPFQKSTGNYQILEMLLTGKGMTNNDCYQDYKLRIKKRTDPYFVTINVRFWEKSNIWYISDKQSYLKLNI